MRQALGLDLPETPVKVVEPFQMLGEIAPDLMEALGVDIVPLWSRNTLFGFPLEDWKPWTLFDGTPVLVPGGFNTNPEPNGDILLYPEGDETAPASGRMPKDGWYFDAIVRQGSFDEDDPDVEDNVQEYQPISEDALAHFGRETDRLWRETDKAIYAVFGGTSFGDIAVVPGQWLKHPRGIRNPEEWLVCYHTRKGFLRKLFERQCEVALHNLERIHGVVGNRVAVVFVTGADFGTQCAPLFSLETYRNLLLPFHREINNWIHRNTTWKSFIHSCGSVWRLLPGFVEAEFDILNPVQCSAAEMDAIRLKQEYGARLSFWGGAVDTQKTLPFGAPEEVRREVRERIATFGPGGGFVFNAIHNIQARIPLANLLAFFETYKKYRDYPLGG
ncbi:MAG: methyltransferase, partial [Candidatus Sumerlaeota bacterium]|nr:methyltransferase [Candidatus Sumerlaeota bacterium]